MALSLFRIYKKFLTSNPPFLQLSEILRGRKTSPPTTFETRLQASLPELLLACVPDSRTYEQDSLLCRSPMRHIRFCQSRTTALFGFEWLYNKLWAPLKCVELAQIRVCSIRGTKRNRTHILVGYGFPCPQE